MKNIFLLTILFVMLGYAVNAQVYSVNTSCSNSFTDISGTGTSIGAMGDDGETTLTLPFSFTLYGTTSTDIVVGNNGAILFDVTTGEVGTANTTLTGGTEGFYPLWDDLYTGGDVYYETTGTAPNRVFIVQWDRNHYDCQGGNAVFQVLLFEGTNEIVFLYDDLYFDLSCGENFGETATVGIQGASLANQVYFNTAFFDNCISFIPCTPPTASMNQICSSDYLSYDLEVTVTDLGDAASVNINDGTTTYFSGVGLGTHTILGLTSSTTIYVENSAQVTCEYSEAISMCDICSDPSVPSDECISAPLIDLSQPFAGSTDCSYTASVGSPSVCGMSIQNDSWIRFIAGSTEVEMDYDIGDCNPIGDGVQLAVFSGSCGSLSLLTGSCVNPTGELISGTWNFSGLTIGNTYYIRIDGYAGDLCGYSFTPVSGVVLTPENDTCEDATVLTCGSSEIASNILATATDAPSACSGGGTTAKGVWYTFAGTDETVTISTDNAGTNFDTQINAYEGTCGSLSCIGGDDDSGTGTTSELSFYAASGTDYFIYVDGDGTEEGQFEISLACCGITAGITNNTGTTVLDCNNPTISLTATGGVNYAWSGGATPGTANNTVSSPATYTVTVDDGAGCSATANIDITQDISTPTAGITNNTGTTVINCITTNISLTATGGDSYAWSGGATPGTANNTVSSPNTYTVTVTATNGCTDTEDIIITENTTPPPAGITNNTGTNVLDCSTTSISLTATGGSNYSWSGGATPGTANNTVSSTNTYTVTVTGANGCTATDNIVITEDVSAPTAGITNNTGTTVLDCTITDISLTATGGDSYAWSGGATPGTANNTVSTPNTYTVTVTGLNGCTATDNIAITQSVSPPTAGINNNTGTTVLDCNNTSISLTATGGDSYAWSGGATPGTANNTVSTPNTYTVTVTALNGCTASDNIVITQNITPPPAGITNNTGTTVLDCTITDISLTATGGDTYVWSGGATPGTANNTVSSPNTYTVTVTGLNGCTATDNIVITQSVVPPTAIITNNTGLSELNCTITDISLTASGGDSYAWSGGVTPGTDNNTVSNPDTYTVTVTALNGCTDTESIVITEDLSTPTAGITNNTGTNTLDCNNVTISLTATGGADYIWSGGSSPTTANNSVSSPNTFTVTVTGTNGCTAEESIIIDEGLSPPSAGITNNTGANELDCSIISISVTATGGDSYAWSGGSTPATSDNSFSTPDTYTVTVTGANGCTSTENIIITQSVVPPTAIITNNTGSEELNCINTEISLTASGGDSYVWSGGATPATASNIVSTPDTYTVTVTALNGCTDTETIVITEDISVPTAGITNNSGATELDCALTLISLTATGGDSYLWSGGNTPTLDNNSVDQPNTYTVTVTGLNGCTSSESIVITQYIDTPTAGITNNTGTDVLDCAVTTISLTATGGTSYEWSAGSSVLTADNTVTTPAMYFVTVTGGNSCTSTAQIEITEDIAPPIVEFGDDLEICESETPVTLDAGAGIAWTWSTTEDTQTIDVSTTGNYSVTVTGANSCTASDNIQVTIEDLITPLFDTFGPYCENDESVILPLTSNNSITGAWTPAVVDIDNAGTSTYNFVANTGQCAEDVSIDITINEEVLPVFNIFGPYCEGDEADVLPAESNNGITGTWEPTIINTINIGEEEYLFTPSDMSGCNRSSSVLISVFEYPQISVSPEDVDMLSSETLDILVTGADTYSWAPLGVLSCDNCSSPFFTSPATQLEDSTYIFYVTASNANCSVIDSVMVTVLADVELVIPQGFSPNGDGIAETWEIKGIDRYPENSLYIYNRWGALVYSSDNYMNTWGGQGTSDSILPEGSYYYVLNLVDKDDKPLVYKGYVYIGY